MPTQAYSVPGLKRNKASSSAPMAMKSPTKKSTPATGKDKQYSGKEMAKKYMQSTQKNNSARITGNVWGSGKVSGKGK